MLAPCSALNGQLIERVATEFNRLQFYVSKVRGLPLVDELKPVINACLLLSLAVLNFNVHNTACILIDSIFGSYYCIIIVRNDAARFAEV